MDAGGGRQALLAVGEREGAVGGVRDSPITTTWATPAAHARSSTSARSGSYAGSARWQWVSTSMGNVPLARACAPA